MIKNIINQKNIFILIWVIMFIAINPVISVEKMVSNNIVDDNIQTIEYCDLLRNPDFFNNQEVRLTTNYIIDFEQSEFQNSNCNEQFATWVTFDKIYQNCSDKKALIKFNKIINNNSKNGPKIIKLTVVGKFNGPREGILIKTSKEPLHIPGYGHMGVYKYEFIIRCIEYTSILVDK